MAKIGAGALSAAVRQGAKELAQALVALPDSNIRPVEEPGALGNLTPGEVMAAKEPDRGFEAEVQQAAQAARAAARGRGAGMEMG